jgi:hypothetical protein
MMIKRYKGFLVTVITLSVVLVTACGGGGGSGSSSVAGGGIGGTGMTSGTVTGFGSVFVNGIEFETDGASRDVDDRTDISNGSDDDKVLDIGMVVTIIGTVNDDGVTGTAESITYDDDIEGPVAAAPLEDPDGVTKTFSIFNTTVIVDRTSTVFADTDYASLARDDLLEVSGYFDASGNLRATRVEKEGVLVLGKSEVELRGDVKGFDGVDRFTLGGVTVTFDGTTEFEDLPGTVKNGQFVEVEGTLETATSVAATRIEREDDGFDNNIDEVSIEGLVTDFNGTNDFRVAGQLVEAGNADFEPASLENTLADGVKVEVEGSIEGGILKATEVEQRGGDARVSAVVVSSNNTAGTIMLQVVQGEQNITVFTDTRTQFEDKRDELEPFGINDIATNDFLVIEGYVDGDGDFIVAQVERDEPGDIELRGPADVPPTSGDDTSGTVSILGVSIRTNSSTDFEDASDGDISGTQFFIDVENLDLVEFTDKDPADGIADEVEFED